MRRPQVPCPHCHDTVLHDFLDAHVLRKHSGNPLPNDSSSDWVQCPHCGLKLWEQCLDGHVCDVHAKPPFELGRPNEPQPVRLPPPSPTKIKKGRKKMKKLTRRINLTAPFISSINNAPAPANSPVSERFLSESSMPLVD